MNTLIFTPPLIEWILIRRKPGTIRLYLDDNQCLRPGEEFVGDFGPRGKYLLRATENTAILPFKELTTEHLLASGYADHDDAFDSLSGTYPTLCFDSLVIFIGFDYLGELDEHVQTGHR